MKRAAGRTTQINSDVRDDSGGSLQGDPELKKEDTTKQEHRISCLGANSEIHRSATPKTCADALTSPRTKIRLRSLGASAKNSLDLFYGPRISVAKYI